MSDKKLRASMTLGEAAAYDQGWRAAREAAAKIADSASDNAHPQDVPDAHVAADLIRAMEPPA